jgi:hypothetical protein
MQPKNNNSLFAIAGMAGAAFFIFNLIIEYRYDLFPPGEGPLYVANQLGFFAGMIGLLIMLVGLWRARAAGDGWFGRLALGLFIVAWTLLILGGFISLFTGNADSFLQPLGGLGGLLGAVLTGIAVVLARRWTGWQRFAPLAQGLFMPAMMIIRGEFQPTFVIEVVWMGLWFLTSLALYTARPQPATGLIPSEGEATAG